MVVLEEIKPGSRLRGVDPEGVAEVVQVARFGADALNLVFRVNGRVGERLVYRGEEASFEAIEAGRSCAFDADGGLLRLQYWMCDWLSPSFSPHSQTAGALSNSGASMR